VFLQYGLLVTLDSIRQAIGCQYCIRNHDRLHDVKLTILTHALFAPMHLNATAFLKNTDWLTHTDVVNVDQCWSSDAPDQPRGSLSAEVGQRQEIADC